MPVTAVVNQKGGVGKTTVALNLAYEWSRQGQRVLLIDVDKQAAASSSLLAAPLNDTAFTLTDVLRDDHDGARILIQAEQTADPHWNRIRFVPASLDLEDVWAISRPGLIFRLRRALDEADVHTRYDRVILDGPPDLGVGTVAACIAADHIVIPTRPERMSMHGVARTVETINVVRRDMRPDVVLAGIVAVAVDQRLNEHRARLAELHDRYGDQVTDVCVPHRLRADEASGAGLPAAMLPGPAGTSLGETYADLCRELDQRVESDHHDHHATT